MEFVSVINKMLGILTVTGQIVVIGGIVLFVVRRRNMLRFFGQHALVFSFAVALVATLGSLFYSEIAGYEPCKLCWLQRIFIYPQVLLLGMALWKKDRGIADYSIVLSAVGAVIAGYHYLLQLGVAPSLPCAAVGYSVSCAQRFVMQFGYITIPLMAFTAFIMILLFMVSQKLAGKELK
ncbi:MAG: disulfide oxidoreductase [bacterium]|nr:disulfide oxidoreductase [bacterium]